MDWCWCFGWRPKPRKSGVQREGEEGLEGWRAGKRVPGGWAPQGWGLEGGGFACFPSPVANSVLVSLSGCLCSWDCGRGSRPWPTQSARFGFCGVKRTFPDVTAFFVLFKAHDFRHFSSLTSSRHLLPLSSSLPLLQLSHLFFCLRFLLWSFLSMFCVVAVAASGAALLPQVAAAVAAAGGAVVARFAAVLRFFRQSSLWPLLSCCQMHSSARRVKCM